MSRAVLVVAAALALLASGCKKKLWPTCREMGGTPVYGVESVACDSHGHCEAAELRCELPTSPPAEMADIHLP